MPLLRAEPSQFPDNLFDSPGVVDAESERVWWVLHTKPRQEKSVTRQLNGKRPIPFYLPLIQKRKRHQGRTLTSYVPLFAGYVFLFGTREERLTALTTNRVAQVLEVADQAGLWRDLRQVHQLIASGAPITPEERLSPGMMVEIKSGPLAGLKGRIIRAATGKRFIVQVNFIKQGASVLLDNFSLRPDETPPMESA